MADTDRPLNEHQGALLVLALLMEGGRGEDARRAAGELSAGELGALQGLLSESSALAVLVSDERRRRSPSRGKERATT